jgi:hypothetical protein
VLHHALTAHASSFPVIESDGRLEGLVTLRRLRQRPRDEWAGTTLASAAVPLDQLALATPDELLVDVLHRSGRADGRVLVLDHDQRLVGIVTPTDVTAALEGRRLAEHSADDPDDHDEVQHDRQQVLHDRSQGTRPERGIGAGAGATSRSTPTVTFGPGPASASEGHSMKQTLGEQGDDDEAPFVDGGDHLQ